jgi:hypothetical protein
LTVRRGQILLASAEGQSTTTIARHVHCTDQTVRHALHAFHQRGLTALPPHSSRPHTTATSFDAGTCASLRALLHQRPRTFGQPTSRWTLALAAEGSFAQGLTPRLVSDEAIRLALRRLQVSWKRAQQWITRPDPAYARKKTGVTGGSSGPGLGRCGHWGVATTSGGVGSLSPRHIVGQRPRPRPSSTN